MDKIGLEVEVAKSGEHKDMGAYYRAGTEEEKGLYQRMVKELADAFVGRVLERRKLASAEAFADARVMSATEAKAAGLIDGLGYLDDALAAARELAGLPADARVLAYRRNEVADDNAWAAQESGGKTPKLLDLGVTRYLAIPSAGFYYLWAPELAE
jgi:protease IV